MRIRTLNDIMKPIAPNTLAEWEKTREEIIANLKFASSIELLRHDAPLNPKFLGTVEYENFVIEKVVFESLPGFYVTGNLYRPKDTSKKYPAILNPHGHWTHGRFETKDLARLPQRCANFAMRGMVAFIYDMIGYNDSAQLKHNGFTPEYEKWNFGRFSLQLNNSRRAIDFVASLPYVDADRIGCTGCSGGGTQTYFITALDERIKAAAPINMASTRMQGGCICENTAFLRTVYNNIDYTMVTAPRPLFMSASDGDWTIKSETVEFPAVEYLYRLYGASDKYEHFYQSAPHCYNLPIRERVYKFFCRAFGIDDPFDGEIDLEIDTEQIRIGELPPCEGYIHDDEEMFALAKKIICSNLKKLTASQRFDLVRRVYALDTAFDLDIPYIAEEDKDGNYTVTFGACPAETDTCGAKYPHCYNYAEDTRRVNALTHLFAEYPGAKFVARGKTAALCAIAARLSDSPKLELGDADDSDVFIPGSALLENL